MHGKMPKKDFVKYMKNWIDGNPIQSKNPNLVMTLDLKTVKEFIVRFLKNQQAKNFVIQNYGEDIWNTIEQMMRERYRET